MLISMCDGVPDSQPAVRAQQPALTFPRESANGAPMCGVPGDPGAPRLFF